MIFFYAVNRTPKGNFNTRCHFSIINKAMAEPGCRDCVKSPKQSKNENKVPSRGRKKGGVVLMRLQSLGINACMDGGVRGQGVGVCSSKCSIAKV